MQAILLLRQHWCLYSDQITLHLFQPHQADQMFVLPVSPLLLLIDINQ